MAIFYLCVKTIQRSAGRSSVAAAAYRAGERIEDPRTGEIHDYTRRRDIVATGIEGWSGERDQLWRACELSERRRDSVVAREIVLALPHELSRDRQRKLITDFARWISARHGIAADWAIHAPDSRGDQRAVHAHCLITTRRITAEGALGKKARELDTRPDGPRHFEAWRHHWADLCNEALREAGADARIDHRSYERQSQETRMPAQLPQVKLGPAATRLGRRGIKTAAHLENALREALNLSAFQLQHSTRQLIELMLGAPDRVNARSERIR